MSGSKNLSIDQRAADSLAVASGLYGGCFGLIATNTIGQGDTRSTGLRWICTHGGTIYAARKRLKWPGQAAVVVSVVNVCRGAIPKPFVLDGREVPIITAYLFHAGGHDDPDKLTANDSKSYIGCFTLGMGFTFDDTDKSGVANTLSSMHELIARDPRNAERIFPFIGGEEVNDHPNHAHHRYVINFGEMNEDDARRWPDLFRVVEDKVKPERQKQNDEIGKRRWWQFLRPRRELYSVISSFASVLVCPIISNKLSFAFLRPTTVFSHKLAVLCFQTHDAFGILQSRVHEVWARTFSSTMKDDLNYSPADCFETFPFPAGVLEHAAGDSPTTDNGPLTTLETAGREYYEFRAALMVRHNEGLTKTYNRFHDPHETSPDILQLRALHAAMDRAVLEAYGWHDLAQTATCEFLLDYEDDEDEDDSQPQGASRGSRRQKKKPWRYRWPDPFRDEVLAKLLELNKQRHKEELLTGKFVSSAKRTSDDSDSDEDEDSSNPKKASKKTKSPKASKKSPASGQQEMEF